MWYNVSMAQSNQTEITTTTIVVSVRMSPELRDRIKELARAGYRSMNQQILLLIDLGLEALNQSDTESAD